MMDERFRVIVEELQEAPYVGSGIKLLKNRYPERYGKLLDRHLEALLRYYGGDVSLLEVACDAFMEMTIETLRMQSRFFRTGEFSLPEAERVKIHHDEELMAGPYLTGLFLSAVFWENHFEKMIYFEDVFVPQLPQGPRLLDVGPGSGLYCALARLQRPRALMTVNDISPYSKSMAERISFCADTEKEIDFVLGSFPEAMRPINRRFDAIIFSDVVEHLPDPQAGMETLRQLLAPGGTIFFATATNAAFWDHTIIFENVDQIKGFIHNNGFKIRHQIEITVFENPDGRKVVDYLAVLHADED